MATIVHLEIKTTRPHQHYYYGCKSLVFENHSELLDMKEYEWRTFRLSPDNPFENDKCIVRKGEIVSKKTNRGGNLKTDNPRKVAKG